MKKLVGLMLAVMMALTVMLPLAASAEEPVTISFFDNGPTRICPGRIFFPGRRCPGMPWCMRTESPPAGVSASVLPPSARGRWIRRASPSGWTCAAAAWAWSSAGAVFARLRSYRGNMTIFPPLKRRSVFAGSCAQIPCCPRLRCTAPTTGTMPKAAAPAGRCWPMRNIWLD